VYTAAIGFGRALFRAVGIKRHAIGLNNLPNSGGAVFAITHFGYLDFALVEWLTWSKNRRRIRFMATKSAFEHRLSGPLLRGMRHISVDMRQGAAAYEEAVTALQSGEILGVFPEGGVSSSFTVRELKTGAVRMASEAGVPIIPIAIWGGHRLITKNRRASLREAWGTPVWFGIGEPITVTPSDDPQALTQYLKSALQVLVDRLQATYPVSGKGKWWQPFHLGGTAPTPAESVIAENARQKRKAAARADRANLRGYSGSSR
jgi:1-acyl-sn-glycerol-3-phosphate acyltransferase